MAFISPEAQEIYDLRRYIADLEEFVKWIADGMQDTRAPHRISEAKRRAKAILEE